MTKKKTKEYNFSEEPEGLLNALQNAKEKILTLSGIYHDGTLKMEYGGNEILTYWYSHSEKIEKMKVTIEITVTVQENYGGKE